MPVSELDISKMFLESEQLSKLTSFLWMIGSSKIFLSIKQSWSILVQAVDFWTTQFSKT